MIQYFWRSPTQPIRQGRLVVSHQQDSHHTIHWNTPFIDTLFHVEPGF